MMRFFFALDLRPETESRISDQRFAGAGAGAEEEATAAMSIGRGDGRSERRASLWSRGGGVWFDFTLLPKI
jgi:hypothetical protein